MFDKIEPYSIEIRYGSIPKTETVFKEFVQDRLRYSDAKSETRHRLDLKEHPQFTEAARRTFDYHLIGLSNVAWSMTGELTIDYTFIQSISTRTLFHTRHVQFISGCDAEHNSNQNYLDRVRKKYDFKLGKCLTERGYK